MPQIDFAQVALRYSTAGQRDPVQWKAAEIEPDQHAIGQ